MVVSQTLETRRHQMFPVLTPEEIARLRHYGEEREFPAGHRVMKVGEPSLGMLIVLEGELVVTSGAGSHGDETIITIGPGSFTGELTTLSGRPVLVNCDARAHVRGILIPPERVPDLLVEQAELGERITRAFILRRVALMETGIVGPVIVGSAGDPDVLRLEGFLARNGYPMQKLDPGTDDGARALIARLAIAPEQLPIVLCPNGEMLRNPSEAALARCIGMVQPIDGARTYDVAIVGAGPAGLAAAVYAGSEGLSALALDARAFGGQAGASMRIENYLGFPTGISGMALMGRAYVQAEKFGVDVAIPDEARSMEPAPAAGGTQFLLQLANGESVHARTVVVASGARYRRLELERLGEFERASVHYWASAVEARLCKNEEIAIVGGGNSAGQAAVYLSGHAAKVWLLCRRSGLHGSMSRYLIERLAALPNVEVRSRTHVTALEGDDGVLERVRWSDGAGEETCRPVRHLFLFIGAEPNTAWLANSGVALDGKGFVRTNDPAAAGLPLGTSVPGVFAIGDVRSGSVKRVAAAVGEGAQVVASIHAFLASTSPAAARVVTPAEGHRPFDAASEEQKRAAAP